MMRKLWLLSVLLLAGCWDTKEPERMLYIHGLGMDYEDEQYVTYAQIIDFTNIAKSDQPNNPNAVQAEVGRGKGRTPSEALHDLYQSADQRINWGHFSYVVFSEALLKSGQMDMVLNTFTRFSETRYNILVYSTQDSLEEIMLTTPIINRAISQSKLSDPYNSYQQQSLIWPLNIRQLIIDLTEPSYVSSIPFVKLIEDWTTKDGPSTVTQIAGVSVISATTLKGVLQQEDARGLQWLSNETKQSGITIDKVGDEEQAISFVFEHIHVDVTPVITQQQVLFDVTIHGNATLRSFAENVTQKSMREAIEKQMTKEIRRTFEAALAFDADVYRLEEYLYRKYPKQRNELSLSEETLRNITIHIEKITVDRKSYKEVVK
ncbi:MAG: Ger(x)C family spore germination protein [Solibacillus sp.]